MTKEVLKMALEALEEAADAIDSWGSYASGYFQVKHDLEGDISKAKSAITTVKEALAQPEQEPNKNGSPCPEFWDWLPKAYNFEGDGNFTKYNMEVAFLAGKQASQPEQEPVKLRRGDILRCIETDELCTVWATSTSGKTLVKWGSNDFTNYTSEQIGELFWLEEKNT